MLVKLSGTDFLEEISSRYACNSQAIENYKQIETHFLNYTMKSISITWRLLTWVMKRTVNGNIVIYCLY